MLSYGPKLAKYSSLLVKLRLYWLNYLENDYA